MGCCKLTGGGVSISSVSGELLPESESLSVATYTTVNVLVALGAISTSASVGHEHVNQMAFMT